MTERSFEIEFRRLYIPLCMYALRMVEDIDDARDVVQEAFSKAWCVVQSDQEIANFKAYMYRMVRNDSISLLRNRHDYKEINDIEKIDDTTIDTSERDARLWNEIEKLPEQCRRIFLMSKRDGLSNAEIAQELGISVKTVKNQITKAFSRLREALSYNKKPFFLPFL